MSAKLLIVDDEENVRSSLLEYFTREGYEVQVAQDGPQAIELVRQSNFDIIILDVVMPPHFDGIETCRRIRKEFGDSIGIIMISEPKKEVVDRVVGLEIGADDYVIKPFETRELLARVKAVLRRQPIRNEKGQSTGWIVVDNHLRINFKMRKVEAGGQEVHLTRLEFDLLKYLAERPGEPCGKSDLIDNVWIYDEDWDTSDQAIATCVSRLRNKIEPDPSNPIYIQSVRGIGYRFKEA